MMHEEDFGIGLRYQDTVLIGVYGFGVLEGYVDCCEAVALHQPSGVFYRGVVSHPVTMNRPPLYPMVSQEQMWLTDDDLKGVRNRDRSKIPWTSVEVPSFPAARGFYAPKTLVDLVTGLANFTPLKFYERKDDGSLIGFGTYEGLESMMAQWHDVLKPKVDVILREYLQGSSSNINPRELAFNLYCLGGIRDNDQFYHYQEEDLLRVLLARNLDQSIPPEKDLPRLYLYFKKTMIDAAKLNLQLEKLVEEILN
ncbi:MAG TPA: hypothetical protein VJC39_02345 [Candidatus Nanoarchaeia archaeon]|nr:hypothetical protein [Candidatus Nanoarchaeia archaeon]